MRHFALWAVVLCLSGVPIGCGGGGGGDGGGGVGVAPEVAVAGILADGGSSTGTAGSGGQIAMIADGSIVIGSSAEAPVMPTPPVPPSSGTALTSDDLSHDVTLSGTILISNQVASSGIDPFRSIMSLSGDIVVTGALTATQQGLGLSAPHGTVYVTGLMSTAGGALMIEGRNVVITGTLDTRSPAGAGGAVAVTASGGDISFTTGSIMTAGAGGASQGGDGGNISLQATGSLHLDGVINARGGNADGSSDEVRGGKGGDISILGSGSINLVSVLTARGGSAATTGLGAVGGAGGTIDISGSAAARLYGAIDTRGGSASAADAGTGVVAGDGGSVSIGSSVSLLTIELADATYSARGGSGAGISGSGGTISASGDRVTVADTLDARGGDGTGEGPAAGGAGGMIELTTFTWRLDRQILLEIAAVLDCSGGTSVGPAPGGNGGLIVASSTGPSINLSGTITARGANSALKPGAGGTVRAICENGGGSVASSAAIDVSGGSSAAAVGDDVDGGAGGRVEMSAFSAAGSVTLSPGSVLLLDGGSSTGIGTAGAGGVVDLNVPENFISIGGSTLARGGPARGPGGRGGRGGLLDVNADSDGIEPSQLPPGSPPPPPIQIGGTITVEEGALVDVSGGSGTIGGSARNDGTSDVSNNTEQTCVLLDADTGSTNGALIVNKGAIVARGAANNGSGGDVMFHGRGETTKDPLEGFQDRRGSGSGSDGQVLLD